MCGNRVQVVLQGKEAKQIELLGLGGVWGIMNPVLQPLSTSYAVWARACSATFGCQQEAGRCDFYCWPIGTGIGELLFEIERLMKCPLSVPVAASGDPVV